MELTLQDRILLELDMTNALRPSELFAFRWKCFEYEACTLKIMETVYKARFDLGERPRRVSRSSISRGVLRTIFSNGGSNVPIHPGMPSFSRTGRVGSDTDNYRSGASQTRPETETSETHVPGHSEDGCNIGPKKGTVKDVQGVLRHSRTATTTDVYMQEIPEGVRGTIDSIHRELMKSPS